VIRRVAAEREGSYRIGVTDAEFGVLPESGSSGGQTE
jgi:hypothetical protein